jgi:alpha-mannosidase
MEVPASLAGDGRRRAEVLVRLDIETCINLHAGSPRIDFHTRIENRAKDHRVRVLFPTWLATGESISDAHFDVVCRDVKILQPSYDEWTEDAPVTMPLRSWCAATDGSIGLALFSRGLPEYELCDTAERPLALTLLRSVGSLGGGPGNLALSRPAGPDIPTPGAQCLGAWTFEYAILPFQGSWEEAGITRAAAEYVNPLYGYSPIAQNSPSFSPTTALAVLEPDLLEYSAFRQLPGGGTELRVFNPTSATTQGRAEFPGLVITQAACTDLLGHTLVVPEFSGSTVGFTVGPKKIVTLRLGLKEAGT